MADDPAPLLLRPGKKAGTSTNVTSGMLNASQKRTKRAAFTEESMSSTPASERGWLPTTPTMAAEPCEAADDVLGPVLVHLEEVAVVDDAADDVVHVVRLVRVVRDQRVELGSSRPGGSAGSEKGGGSRLFCGRNESR